MVDGSATWIAKPSITNQAIGICIFDRVSTLRSALEAAEDMREWVVQRQVLASLDISMRDCTKGSCFLFERSPIKAESLACLTLAVGC